MVVEVIMLLNSCPSDDSAVIRITMTLLCEGGAEQLVQMPVGGWGSYGKVVATSRTATSYCLRPLLTRVAICVIRSQSNWIIYYRRAES